MFRCGRYPIGNGLDGRRRQFCGADDVTARGAAISAGDDLSRSAVTNDDGDIRKMARASGACRLLDYGYRLGLIT